MSAFDPFLPLRLGLARPCTSLNGGHHFLDRNGDHLVGRTPSPHHQQPRREQRDGYRNRPECGQASNTRANAVKFAAEGQILSGSFPPVLADE